MKLKSDFIFASIALRHIVQWYLKCRVWSHIEAKDCTIEFSRPPVPAFKGQLFLQHIFIVVSFEELSYLFLFLCRQKEQYNRVQNN